MLAVGEVLTLSETLSNGDLEGFYRYAAEVRDLLGTNVLIRISPISNWSMRGYLGERLYPATPDLEPMSARSKPDARRFQT